MAELSQEELDSMMMHMAMVITMRRKEVKRLMKDPSKEAIALALMDEMMKGLDVLFHFRAATTNSGTEVCITSVYEKMEAGLLAKYKEVTGKEYVRLSQRAFEKEGG